MLIGKSFTRLACMWDLNAAVFAAGNSEGICTGSSLVPEEWLERDGRHPRVRLTARYRHLTHCQIKSKDLRRSTRLPSATHLAPASVCFYPWDSLMVNCMHMPQAVFNYCLWHRHMATIFTCVSYAEARNRYRLDVRLSVRHTLALYQNGW